MSQNFHSKNCGKIRKNQEKNPHVFITSNATNEKSYDLEKKSVNKVFFIRLVRLGVLSRRIFILKNARCASVFWAMGSSNSSMYLRMVETALITSSWAGRGSKSVGTLHQPCLLYVCLLSADLASVSFLKRKKKKKKKRKSCLNISPRSFLESFNFFPKTSYYSAAK